MVNVVPIFMVNVVPISTYLPRGPTHPARQQCGRAGPARRRGRPQEPLRLEVRRGTEVAALFYTLFKPPIGAGSILAPMSPSQPSAPSPITAPSPCPQTSPDLPRLRYLALRTVPDVKTGYGEEVRSAALMRLIQMNHLNGCRMVATPLRDKIAGKETAQ